MADESPAVSRLCFAVYARVTFCLQAKFSGGIRHRWHSALFWRLGFSCDIQGHFVVLIWLPEPFGDTLDHWHSAIFDMPLDLLQNSEVDR